jgi:hypothetical protein
MYLGLFREASDGCVYCVAISKSTPRPVQELVCVQDHNGLDLEVLVNSPRAAQVSSRIFLVFPMSLDVDTRRNTGDFSINSANPNIQALIPK